MNVVFVCMCFWFVVFVSSSEKLHNKKNYDEVFAWKQLGYDFDGIKYENSTNTEYKNDAIHFPQDLDDSEKFFIQSNNVPIGFEVYGDRAFITVPRRRHGIPSTLNFINLNCGSTLLKPYPDVKRSRQFFSVYRPRVDACHRLWMVDTGHLEVPGERKQVQPSAIVIYDLKTDRQILRHELHQSLLVNERTSAGLTSITVDVDPHACGKAFAYINDLATEGLIVFSLEEQQSWRLEHPSFRHDEGAMNFTAAGHIITWRDGLFSIALSAPGKRGSRTAYYHPLVSTQEFSVDTSVLKDRMAKLEEYVKVVGDRGPNSQSGSHDVHHPTGTVFYANVAQDAILCWNTMTSMTPENVVVVAQDSTKLAYISDLKVSGNEVWVLANQIPRFIFNTQNRDDFNYFVLRCEQWAKYIFPDRNVSSVEFQKKLYNEHRMLCEKHFKDEDFTDSSKKHLVRTAVPCDTEQKLPIFSPDQPEVPGPSKRNPLGNISNAQINMEPGNCTSNEIINVEPGRSSIKPINEKEKILQLKCTKYLRKISQLHNRIKKLKSNAIFNTLVENKTVKKLSAKITPAFALLLHGQIRNSKRKITGRRWSKNEKITALRIFKRSPTCYRLLRGLFTLPSPTTLKNLLNKVPFDVGCNEAVFKVLKKYISTQKPEDAEFILMFDEMSLKKHLNYNSKHDIIEGYQDHGTQGRSGQIAGYALVFMIGGIRKRIKQPVAHYFSSSFSTADRLAVLIKEVLHHCTEAGINIAATVCDMDGVNRRALSILGASLEHPYITVENKEIITMYDTPHLLKCFRNLFMKYDVECTTNIHSAEKTGKGVAKWSHIRDFHEIDNSNPNFVFAPCLKKEHLNPNQKQKMKVNLAAQVLSHSVAAGMFAKISDGTLTTDAAVTANVLSNMDKLFDSLNSDSANLRRGKPYATNLTATTPHIKLFLEMKLFFTTMKFVGSPRKPPSQDGWVWNLKAVERLWRNLGQKYKIKSLATRRLQQDPLENLFGCIRGNCGSNTNPTCGQFLAGLKTSILSNLSHMGTTGNCETDNSVIINNFDTLLSVSQPKTHTHTEAAPETTFNVSSVLSFEVDEGINEGTAEIQACAYVCGFLIKLLPTKTCENCKKIFLSQNLADCHVFVECREYNDYKKNLNYVSKEMIACVEYCASLINDFLREKSHTNFLKKIAMENLKSIVNFDFMAPCATHQNENVNVITESVFIICTKRFCILKNRALADEASASALKRKMDIILHK